MDKNYDLVVVGSGPGGYQAAIRAAQLGMSVACVERDELGGICGNWGCIPTKALLRSAELLETMRRARDFGLRAENVRFEWKEVVARSRAVAAQQAKGVGYLFKKNGIDHLKGTARLEPGEGERPWRLRVDDRPIATARVLLATGARPKALPNLEHDGDRVLSYKEAMVLGDRPRRLLVIGAGAIGIEFAYFYAALGTKVIVLEALDQILPVEDEEVSQALAKSLGKLGVEIHTGVAVDKLEKGPGGVKVIATRKGTDERIEVGADRALLAVGVRGNVEGLGLEEVGVAVERGFIRVERPTYATSVAGVFAIGDVVGPPLLAHKASAEGIACVERMAQLAEAKTVDYGAIPGCTYCRPEVASVGLTERAAREAGHEITVGRFPLSANGKARAWGEAEGFVKVVLGRHGELVGAHLLGGDATDLVAELTLAKTAELTSDEILAAVHAHPTFAEAIKEAVAAAEGEAIDI